MWGACTEPRLELIVPLLQLREPKTQSRGLPGDLKPHHQHINPPLNHQLVGNWSGALLDLLSLSLSPLLRQSELG